MADHTLDDIIADTTAERSEIDALATLASGIKTQLDQALSGQAISPAAQAKVDRIFANIQANKDALAAAILANTPAGDPGTATATGTPVSTTVDAPPAKDVPVDTAPVVTEPIAEPDPVVTPTPIDPLAPAPVATPANP